MTVSKIQKKSKLKIIDMMDSIDMSKSDQDVLLRLPVSLDKIYDIVEEKIKSLEHEQEEPADEDKSGDISQRVEMNLRV